MKRSKYSLDAAMEELPLFPLAQVVFFPRATLPLHVFEPRYRAMLQHCLETHGALAVVQVVDPSDLDEHGNPRIADVAGAGVIVEHQKLPDGRSNILLRGEARVRLEELPFVPPFRRARAVRLEDEPTSVPLADATALVAAATAFVSEVKKHDSSFSFRIPPNLQPGEIADLCAHHLLVSPPSRQRLLEELDPAARVRRVLEELALQHGAMVNERRGMLN
jgi:Lon protease-like protein